MASNRPPELPRIQYVSFPGVPELPSGTVAAQLRVPAHEREVPAVVIVHGTSGVDSRGSYHAEALNAAGIATLEPDMWSARGLQGGVGKQGRPEGVPETLPDAFGALVYLAARPGIDARRIGIMGFSWGGVVSMLTATRRYRDAHLGDNPLCFAAHAPFYPVCWGYNQLPGYEFGALTGAPVFIQSGACDAYDAPDSCQKLRQGLPADTRRQVSVTMYPGATHAFDRLQPAATVTDPFAHLGRGGEVRMEPDPAAASRARAAAVDFFLRAFAALDESG